MSKDSEVLANEILDASDEEALALESLGVTNTYNGWQKGDPVDQPENDVEPWND